MNISDDLNYVCKIKKWLRILNISYQNKALNIKHGMNIYDTNDISIEVVSLHDLNLFFLIEKYKKNNIK